MINIKYPKKIKYLFSYQEIITFEKKFNTFFNDQNTFHVPLGLSDKFFTQYESTYTPQNTKFIFVCSKIKMCQYYTKIYEQFKRDLKGYDFTILGKNNELVKKTDPQIANDLSDRDYYQTMSTHLAMYYHGTEPRHVHYHPLEAIVIGLPVIFYAQSLLASAYLANSPGECHSIGEVTSKLTRLKNGDTIFRDQIITFQNKIKERLKTVSVFDKVIESNRMDVHMCCGIGDCLLYCQLNDIYRNRFNFIINQQFVLKYRNQGHLDFMKKLFDKFKCPFGIVQTPIDSFKTTPFSQLIKYYPLSRQTLPNYTRSGPAGPTDLPTEYIVIHVNSRHEKNKIPIHEYDKFCAVCNQFNFKCPVILLGHRNTHQAIDVVNYSFFDKLNKHKFIDKTVDINLVQQHDLTQFETDINLISNAKEVFQIRNGGSLCMSVLFAKQLTALIDMASLPREFKTHFFDFFTNVKQCTSIDELIAQLCKYKI
jgi:hypothetical protein